ncbi:MAG: transposase [Hyalangium sp.]|uniref:transposase n=1 Tax=Hyalangium sp. TaxID=2028555 RepID=UPI00389A1235
MPREKSIPERFHDFVERVGARLHKPNRRFLREAVFGLLERRSVLLSEIGRALEEPRRLIHTEKRLSRGLSSPRYDDAAVEQDYLQMVAHILRDERYPRPTIAVDLTDITKPRARKMPYLATVWDGSEGDIGTGYSIVSVEAVGVRGRRLPLLSRLFSPEDPDFTSQNASIFDAVAAAYRHVPKDAFWVFDSGFDGYNFFKRFEAMGMNYAVRLKLGDKSRFLYTPEGDMKVSKVVEALPLPYKHRPKRKSGPFTGNREVVQVGFLRNVRLPVYTARGRRSASEIGDAWYSLVVAQGASKEPLVILTTRRVMTSEDAGQVVDTYLNRWGVEEANRFTKQGFDLENVRALKWTGLKRMVQLVHLAYGFLATLVHGPRKQVEYLAASFKAFGPVPTYLYYRLLEGIGRLLRVPMDGGP